MKVKLKNRNFAQEEEEAIELEQLLSNLELFEEEPEVSRSIYLYGEIEPNIALRLSKDIENINNIDDELESKDSNYVRKPINIFIDTVGGYCSAGSSIITAIKRSKTQVNGIVTGTCYSMGVPILLSCDRRYASSLAMFMIHSVSVQSISASSIKGYEDALQSTKLVQALIKKFFERELNGNSKFYNDIVDSDVDEYFDQDKALEFGLIHEGDYEFKVDKLDNKIVTKDNKNLFRKWKSKATK